MADPTLKRRLDAGDFVVAPGVFDMMTVLIVDSHLVVRSGPG